MNDATKKAAKKNVASQAGDIAKHIWLAGLGAYGRAFDEAQVRYESASKEAPRLFTELVEKGKKFEKTAKTRLESPLNDTKQSIEERISKMRSGLGFSAAADQEEIKKLKKQVAALTKKVNELTASKAPVEVKAKAPAAVKSPRKLAPKKEVASPAAE